MDTAAPTSAPAAFIGSAFAGMTVQGRNVHGLLTIPA
jgi:hypothetical protein